MKFLSPDARAERRLAICLALIAGYVDAYGLIALGVYVSFMSGNTTQTGLLTGQGKLVAALPSALAIVFFLAGVLVGTWLMHSGLRYSRRLVFGAVSTLLAVIIGVTQLGWLVAEVGIAALESGHGFDEHHAVPRRRGTGESHLCHGHVEQAGAPPRPVRLAGALADAQGPWDTHLRRAGLLASVWAGFLTGAVLSAAAIRYFGVWVLLAPLLILLAMALFSSPDSYRAVHSL